MKVKLIILLLSLLSLNTCNTVEGFGKDLKKGGEAIQNAASGNKEA